MLQCTVEAMTKLTHSILEITGRGHGLKYCEQKWSKAKFVSWSQFILTDEIRKIVLLLQPGANGKKMVGIKILSSWTKPNFKPVFVVKRNVTDEMNVRPVYFT